MFLEGNGLPGRWAGRGQFVILETGFGLGTNFLAAWQAWRADPRRPRNLHFVSTELHPPTREELAAFAPPGCEDLRERLIGAWPVLLAGMHRIGFEDHHVVLTLAFGDAGRCIPDLCAGVDAFFLDGFAPAKNPAMWEPRLFSALSRLARAGASAATWSCARAVRDGLGSAGFETEVRPGFAGKREMLVARFAPRCKTRRHEPPAPCAGGRSAIIVGAGLAGCAGAFALARRGWRVLLVEAGEGVACAASALPAGLLHPLASADHNLASRIVQAGFLWARSELAGLAPAGAGVWSDCGVFQQSQDEQDALLQERWLARLAPPPGHARAIGPDEALAQIGVRPRRGGLWFATGAVVSPRAWCAAMLGQSGGAVRLAPGVRVQSIDGGRVRCADGTVFEAEHVVLAGATGIGALAGAARLELRPVRGRVTLLRGAPAGMRAGLCGDGYLVPPLLGPSFVGATFEDPLTPGAGPFLSGAEADRQNLARLESLVEGPTGATVAGAFQGERCVSRDRLPLVGAIADEAGAWQDREALRGSHPADLPRRKGLWCLGGLGTRGLALASLSGELLASMLEGEPWPIEKSAGEALDPARFLLRALR